MSLMPYTKFGTTKNDPEVHVIYDPIVCNGFEITNVC